jgi:hypothetical protein
MIFSMLSRAFVTTVLSVRTILNKNVMERLISLLRVTYPADAVSYYYYY